MSMHLDHPALTVIGKRKGKKKFQSAEQARRQRELTELWEQNQKQWRDRSPNFSNQRFQKPTNGIKKSVPSPDLSFGRSTRHIPSKADSPGAIAALPQAKVYTGTKILGIGTLHKSNAVPIFSDEEAQDIAKMRR
jgi:hypothetical protein